MIRVRTVLTGVTGSPYYNRLHFAGGSITDAENVHARVAAFWDDVRSHVFQGTQIAVQPDVELVDPGTGQITGIVDAGAVTLSGSKTGQALPWATQGLLRLRTGTWVNGREIRGRIFIPCPEEGDSNSDGPVSAYRTDVNLALADLMGPSATAMSVWSPTRGQIASVISGDVWTEWAVLRSRRD